MKKIILLSFIFFSFSFLKAQGNLQFNAVKYYELSVTQSGSSLTESITSITVPSGKVWKIESASSAFYSPATNNTSFFLPYGSKILLNGRVIFESASGGAYNSPVLPLWLPVGTYNLSIKPSVTTAGYQYVGFMSAIEFNVVP